MKQVLRNPPLKRNIFLVYDRYIRHQIREDRMGMIQHTSQYVIWVWAVALPVCCMA